MDTALMQPDNNPDLGAKDLRNFGLIMGVMIVLFFGLLIPWLWGATLPVWPWLIAAGFWLWALTLPASLRPVYNGWMKVAVVLAWINTRLILGIAFYLVILPISLVLRLFGKDPMARRLDQGADSYRISRQPRDPKHMEKPF